MDRNAAQKAAAEVRARLARDQISGKELATHLGLSAFAVSRRLRGTTPFSLTELDATARFLGIGITELLPEEAAA